MAARFWVGGTGNWSDTAHWSLTTGGAGGQVVPSNLDDVTFDGASGGGTCTLDTATAKVAKTLTINGFAGTLTFNVNLSVSGSITFTTTGFSFAGAATNKLRMIAAGTWTSNGKSIAQNVEIGGTTTFTCTLADALTTAGDLLLSNTTSTIFSGNFLVTAANCTVQGSQTLTLTGNVSISGLTTIADANVINGAFSWTTQSLTTTGALTGTSTIHLSGSGTWQGAAACSCSVTVDAGMLLSGTVLFAASGTPTLDMTNGALSSGTLSVASSCTIVNGDLTGALLTLTAALTLTINGVVLGIDTLTLPNAAVTFAGSFGWTCATYTNTTITATRVTTFAEGLTYRITTLLDMVSAAAQTVRHTWTSNHATNKAKITLDPGATQDVGFLDPTRIDSSGGQTIFTYHGVITTSFNWAVAIASGNLTRTAGGETLAVAGVTYDKTGAILGSCDVFLFRDNGDGTAVFIAKTVSNASTGAYSFTVFPGSTYYTAAFKEGAPDVFDVTDRELVAA